MVTRSVVSTRFSTSVIMSNDPNIAKYFEFVKELTLRAGKIIICNFEAEMDIRTKAAEYDFVTNVDQEIEKMFINDLSKEFPGHKIIAEETVDTTREMPELTDVPTWFIDPIDGTANFVHSFPHSCISIGLTICKEPVLGIIYNPLNSEFYSAIKGEGAFLNGKPICTSQVTELKKALHMYEQTFIKTIKDKDIHIDRMFALVQATQITRNIGSVALTLAYVARGAADCFHMDEIKPWDVAAGVVIVREAGGTVLDTKGGAHNIMKPNTLAASNETLAREMAKLIVDTDLKTQRKRLERT